MMRWISGIFIGAVVVAALFYVPQKGIQAIVVVLSMFGLWEYFRLTQKGVHTFILCIGLIMCGLATSLFIFWGKTSEHFLAIFSGILFLTFILYFRGGSNFSERIKKMAYFYFGIMYLSLLFAHLGLVRALDNWQFWVFLMLASTFLSDTGGYIFGKTIGRHKLAPNISPGKTCEGLLGGWIFSVGSAFVVRLIFWPDYPVVSLIIISTLITFVGLLGDLSESLIKRGVNAKDSGDLIPGHGGLLDRVDALLFAGPVVYYFAKYF